MVDYDEAIKYLGDFGKYQRRIYFALLLAAVTNGLHSLAYVFLAAIPEHRCYIPGLDSSDPQYDDIDFNGTLPYDDKRGEYSKCTYYARNYSNSWTSGEVGQWEEVTCDRWVYDTSQYKSTVTMDWDLVCDRSSLQALGNSLLAVGVGTGSVVFGDLSD
ncbi:PREDICTED: organic cation transporter protein-like, partial [Priapulus caudatus]|uniref:Organic cation transporter protein-like n=1 Tax=Priapulus caudatus TaxID=37621 RepID=A0ABM1F3U6_PRICU